MKATGGNPEGLLGLLKGGSGEQSGAGRVQFDPKFGLK